MMLRSSVSSVLSILSSRLPKPALWQLRRKAAHSSSPRCCFHATTASRQKDLVSVSLNTSTGVATVTMDNPPVNSLSLEMFHSLSEAIKTAEQDSSVQSLILQSSSPSVFSAGLDLMELHQPKPDRLEAFWSAFQQLYLDLYGSRLACIAAIQGHAPAAGCMLALSCDYRIMVGSSSNTSSGETEHAKKGPMIGLNESQLGIVAPPWLAQQMMDTVGIRRAELAMSLGKLYSPEEALAIQLVDEVVPTKELVLEHASQTAVQWGKIPPVARVANKMLVRKKRMDHMMATRTEDLKGFCSFVTTDEVQKSLSMYLEMLATKKAKK